ncbi:hypothetical protein H6F78_03815 [Coleofasciculus sp. FACHB-64]|jgi:hypothetical protein|uniref:hypothetical protein n=1 Tax=Cyanophyceae TaxID=3028117 RepID=UPI0016831743|nr:MULTISPECIES: hypothetical protein [unclassified Coleofasciculus]MBD1837347.1 hypothetical protein [Coleofasciculus sp. FACHB-501]MBD1888506.1 hypothetical protein [Coleofasciculus sp. FACHB-SPT9]MBD1893746.1 hypothetical protein [Coleofasciculus sp. FACHB-129]MBD1944681.1 hypothetical protein [Coleofasciculus sp. FACHB-712]MBD2044766.1 hypothetical protein [Coleofasciculus sp. FACHB-64]
MDRKSNRFVLLIVSCSAAGILVGGVSNWIDSNQCLQAKTPTSECLMQDPTSQTIQGMCMGLIAGAGAALGATLQLKRQED